MAESSAQERRINYIHQKYDIKRTSFKEEDLEFLKAAIEVNMRLCCMTIFPVQRSKATKQRMLEKVSESFLKPEEAHNAVLRYLEWRDRFQVDGLSGDDPDIVRESNIGRVIASDDRDIDGRPIVHIEVRLHDPTMRDMHSLTNYTVYILEQLALKCDENIIDNFCIIFDFKGFSLTNMDYTYVKRLIWILQNCYPERLGVCLLVNSPWIFYGCWSIIKLWINEVTASKIVFIGNQEDLDDFVDISKLPRKLF